MIDVHLVVSISISKLKNAKRMVRPKFPRAVRIGIDEFNVPLLPPLCYLPENVKTFNRLSFLALFVFL